MHDAALLIRPERPDDHAAIHDLTRRAFAPMRFAAGNEQDLIDALRSQGALSLSLVADMHAVVVGHVALSPASHESGATGWFGLGPISVDPALQRRGVGGALIAKAKHWLRECGARGCILVGDTAYYPRHGFHPEPAHTPDGEPQEHFMALSFAGAIPAGRFSFHPAFYA